MSTEHADLVAAARQGAIEAYRRRARRLGLIISVCSVCSAYLGEKDGDGVSDISHGYCDNCMNAAITAWRSSSVGSVVEGHDRLN